MTQHTIKTRFAPSPTGFLHIGGLRTALYNFLFAKANKGKIILRIEDTDQKRFVTGAIENLIATLDQNGIKFDEGLGLKAGKKLTETGNNKPYRQSKRLKIYLEHVDQLLKSGHAYYCFCSEERLKRIKEEQMNRKEPAKYDGHCRQLPEVKIKSFLQEKKPYVVRLKVPDDKVIEFNDLVYGKIKVQSEEIDDQVLLKSDGFPTYHLANVVDDYLMGVTHVIRGEEWLVSTPKHILLYQAFDWPLPLFAHLPLIVNPDKSKLSKRQGDVAVEDFIKQGFLSEALINYIVFLGWNPKDDREIFSLNQLIKEFKIENINKSSAVFDLKKLKWFNSYYIRNFPIEALFQRAESFFKQKKADKKYLKKILEVERSRLEVLSELSQGIEYYFEKPEYQKENIVFKKSDLVKTKQGLGSAISDLEKLETGEWTKENLHLAVQQVVKDNNLNPGDVFWPIRYALSGKDKSPSPEELLLVLGQKESLERLKRALEIL